MDELNRGTNESFAEWSLRLRDFDTRGLSVDDRKQLARNLETAMRTVAESSTFYTARIVGGKPEVERLSAPSLPDVGDDFEIWNAASGPAIWQQFATITIALLGSEPQRTATLWVGDDHKVRGWRNRLMS